MKYNQRKREVLKYVLDFGACGVSDVATALGIENAHARALLWNYHRWGLLNRQTGPMKCGIYSVTAKGENRLAWLERQP